MGTGFQPSMEKYGNRAVAIVYRHQSWFLHLLSRHAIECHSEGTCLGPIISRWILKGTVAFAEQNGKIARLDIDDRDIGPLILGEPDAESPHDVFYYYASDQLQAVRSGPWKLFVPLQKFTQHPHFRPGEGSQPLLFNVVSDVGSTQDVADEHPDC